MIEASYQTPDSCQTAIHRYGPWNGMALPVLFSAVDMLPPSAQSAPTTPAPTSARTRAYSAADAPSRPRHKPQMCIQTDTSGRLRSTAHRATQPRFDGSDKILERTGLGQKTKDLRFLNGTFFG